LTTTVLGQVPGLENGTFYVDIPTGTSTIDPQTGNPTPDTRLMEVHSTLKCNGNPPKQLVNSQPPADVPMMWCEGRVTRSFDPAAPTVDFPPMLPERVPEMIRADLNGLKGRFYPIAQLPDKLLTTYGVADIVGEKIHGWFDPDLN
jgi:hypothetical protein